MRFIVLLVLFISYSAQAIVVEDYPSAESVPLGDWDLDWNYVYRYKLSSAVAVAPNWLLTAAHVADDGFDPMVTVNGTNYFQQEIIFHNPAFDPANSSKADLALVRFDKVFPGSYSLYTGGFPTSPPNKLRVVLVGFGHTGAVFSTYFTMSGSGSGTKRWGTQRIDLTATESYDSLGDTGVTTNQGIRMNFSLTDTDFEAGVNTRDSGGGSFVKEGGVWKLAGINTSYYGSPTNATGVFAVRIPAYHAWITNVITPTADYDGDGIPNAWEQMHSTSITGLVAAADIDNDGFTNWEEYIADTDLNDDLSFPRLSGAFGTSEQTVQFLGSTARWYRVLVSTNQLTDTNLNWQATHTNQVWGLGSNTWITVTNLADLIFYRLEVNLP